MFHTKDGLFFERQANGGVKVVKTPGKSLDQYFVNGGKWFDKDGSQVNITITVLNEWEWVSVVATMSFDGEDAANWRRALDFHKGVVTG